MQLFKLIFYVPEAEKEVVKAACFSAGAGTIGQYSHCAWEVLGQGQFKPLPGSNPTIGEHGCCEQVNEYRVEIVVDATHLKQSLAALLQAHPYETPAYQVIPFYTAETIDEYLPS